MKLVRQLPVLRLRLLPLTAVAALTTLGTFTAAPSRVSAAEALICPISGKPANPNITTVYEEKTYAFASEECRAKFIAARESSLYQKLGGKAAIDAAVERFYQKVLTDARIKHFFDDINMDKQRRKQKEFLSAAFGGPIPYTGKDMRKAHANLTGLNESHFNAVAENLQKTLEELNVPKNLIDQAMAIAASTKNQVLNRPEAPAK